MEGKNFFVHYYASDAVFIGHILKDKVEEISDKLNETLICVVSSYGGI